MLEVGQTGTSLHFVKAKSLVRLFMALVYHGTEAYLQARKDHYNSRYDPERYTRSDE